MQSLFKGVSKRTIIDLLREILFNLIIIVYIFCIFLTLSAFGLCLMYISLPANGRKVTCESCNLPQPY